MFQVVKRDGEINDFQMKKSLPRSPRHSRQRTKSTAKIWLTFWDSE